MYDKQPQSIYDAYNMFTLSTDRKLLSKLFSKVYFLEMVRDIPGDYVELGVFKGTGIMNWLKVNEILHNNSKRVIGFDIFDDKRLVEGISTEDAEFMNSLFRDRQFESLGYEKVLEKKIREAGFSNFELVIGNVLETVPGFLESRPGFRASLINFDLDTYDPTIFCLEAFWDRLVPGGVMILDEYAVDQWTESDAVDEFIRRKGLRLYSTQYESPSAYLVKGY
jgi:hypothetical protein